MKLARCFLLAICLIGSAVTARSQAATPLGAIDELVRAEELADVVRHYPAAVEEVVTGLSENEKAEVSERLNVAFRIREAGYELRRTDDLRLWQFVDKAGSIHASLTLVNYFISGTDSLILFELDSPPEKKELKFAYLRYERGEWRITKFGDGRSDVDLESDGFISDFTSSGRNEKAAAATLMKILSALSVHQRGHPDSSLPAALDVLSQPVTQEESAAEEDSDEPDPEKSDDHEGSAARNEPPPSYVYLPGIIFRGNRAVKDGYEFRYTLIEAATTQDGNGKYQLTATPIEFGETGKKSYFIDQSYDLHFTMENRPANENDERFDYSFMFGSAIFDAHLRGRRPFPR